MVRTQIIQIGLATAALGAGAAAFAADVADAVMRGDAAGARSLLEQRADVNEPQADGATALHWAVYHEDLDTARLLVEAGADPNASNRLGATPMFLASVNGNEAVIELLLEAGTDANETFRNGETPLMFAARTGSVPAIPALLAHGAEIDARENLRGTTALMWAAAYRNAPAVAALVEHGADVGAKSDPIARGADLTWPRRRARVSTRFTAARGRPARLSASISTAPTIRGLRSAGWVKIRRKRHGALRRARRRWTDPGRRRGRARTMTTRRPRSSAKRRGIRGG